MSKAPTITKTVRAPLWDAESPGESAAVSRLKSTCFHLRTSALNSVNAWDQVGEFTVPGCYEGWLSEYEAARSRVALQDISWRRKYRVAGTNAISFLERLSFAQVIDLEVGQSLLTPICNQEGGVIDIISINRTDETAFWVFANEQILSWLIESSLGFQIDVEDVTDVFGALRLYGPLAQELLHAADFGRIGDLPKGRIGVDRLGQGAIFCMRLNEPTLEIYDLIVSIPEAASLWDRLMRAGTAFGLRPLGEEAANVLRVEGGQARAGLDFVNALKAVHVNRLRTPGCLGFEGNKKGHFNGRVAIQNRKTPEISMVGLASENGMPEPGTNLFTESQEQPVGVVASTVYSPLLSREIGMGFLMREAATSLEHVWGSVHEKDELILHVKKVRVKLTSLPHISAPM